MMSLKVQLGGGGWIRSGVAIYTVASLLVNMRSRPWLGRLKSFSNFSLPPPFKSIPRFIDANFRYLWKRYRKLSLRRGRGSDPPPRSCGVHTFVFYSAERARFELAVRLPVHLLSKQAP